MARKKRKSSSSKCPEPFNSLIDLAGAATMRAYVKHQIKKDYEKGRGKESIQAAGLVFGMNSLHRGSRGTIALGGLYGINSAIKDIEKNEQANLRKRCAERPVLDDGIEIKPYQANDNRYAWRLNCEDGSEYGIDPEDYETRAEYHAALAEARGEEWEDVLSSTDRVELELQKTEILSALPHIYCRVSRLDNGANQYYLTDDDTIKVGDTVLVPAEGETTPGIVIAVKLHDRETAPQAAEDTEYIIARMDS